MKTMLIPALAMVLAACGGSGDPTAAPDPGTDEVVLLTHDSFAMSKKVLRDFEEQSGLSVKIVQNGDAGQVVNSAILSAGAPQGDVLFGVDNTFLSRTQQAGIFDDYTAPGADAALAQPGVTPIDTGYVCLNYDTGYFADRRPPGSLADLTRPEYRDLTVVQNPATSSPGLGFLLATVATQSDWQAYWGQLRANGVKVVDGWENAYYQQFSGGSGEGTRPIVVSYSTSPAAEVMFAEDPGTPAPTAAVTRDCFQQVEYAGVLAGARNEAGARELVDFMRSRAFQDQVGEQMFVYPADPQATVPAAFTAAPARPVVMSPEQIAQGRDEWIDQWSQIMEQ
jgi:thiamine transport system substrate-binding protein